ncbi:MAG: DUF6340 family protein [Candidatus Eremiobacteraeota bacterium]|nr:DUF6340 family protein [Candidatus Eremiobacteraeota bacterium]
MNRTRTILTLLAVAIFSLIVIGTSFSAPVIQFDNYERSTWDIGDMECIAVVDMVGHNPGIGEDVSDLIAERIKQHKFLRVLDRKKTNQTLESAGIHIHGIPDIRQAKRICEALNVDGVIYGSMDGNFTTSRRYRRNYRYYYNNDDNRRRRRRVDYEVPYINRSGFARLKLFLYSRDKDKIIGEMENKKSFSKDYDLYYGDYYQSNYPSDSRMLMDLVDAIVKKAVYKFTPHFVRRRRELSNKNNSGTKLAMETKWEEAVVIWKKQLQENPGDFTALKNLGIYNEMEGNTTRAIDCYMRARKIKPGDKKLVIYLGQARNADLTGKPLKAIKVADEKNLVKIAKIESNERVFILGGEEKGIKTGDEFPIVRKIPVFNDDVIKIVGRAYCRIGTLKINKVFEGASMGTITDVAKDYKIEVGDSVVK